MLKFIIAACLSRRAIVVFALLAFAGAGYFAFRALNIEAYPNPTPVILKIDGRPEALSTCCYSANSGTRAASRT